MKYHHFWPYKQLLKHKTIHFTHMNQINLLQSAQHTLAQKVNFINTLEDSPEAVKKQVEQCFYLVVD